MRTMFTICTILLLFGCHSAKTKAGSNSKPEPLELTGWMLQKIDKTERPTTPQGIRITMRMMPQANSVIGFAGCNNFTAKFTRQNNALAFAEVTSTQMACDMMKTETRFMELLLQTNRFEINDNVLTLYKNKTTLLVFESAR